MFNLSKIKIFNLLLFVVALGALPFIKSCDSSQTSFSYGFPLPATFDKLTIDYSLAEIVKPLLIIISNIIINTLIVLLFIFIKNKNNILNEQVTLYYRAITISMFLIYSAKIIYSSLFLFGLLRYFALTVFIVFYWPTFKFNANHDVILRIWFLIVSLIWTSVIAISEDIKNNGIFRDIHKS